MPRWGTRHTTTGAVFLIALACLFSSAVASGAILRDPEGATTSGVNDTDASATPIGAIVPTERILVWGWIDSNDVNDVDFYRFEVTAPGTDVFLDLDFADDAASAEDVDADLDAALWIFNADGRLIAQNDDGDFFGLEIDNEGTDPGSDALADRDAFVGGLSLDAGSYFAAVAWYGKSANAEAQVPLSFTALAPSGLGVSNTTPDTTFASATCSDPRDQCAGRYLLDVRTTFLPEPGFTIGLVLGAGAIAVPRRRFPSRT